MMKTVSVPRNPSRSVAIGSISIGNGHPVVVQSMCATRTQNIITTVAQVNDLQQTGAGIVRIAVDTHKDVEALKEIRKQTSANLSVDLQENYRLASGVAPFVDKIRYNPGHLYHHQRNTPWRDKVRFLVDTAVQHDCALRVGVNCGSVDPRLRDKYPKTDSISPMVESASEHCDFLDTLGFDRYCVSLKDSDPDNVIDANRRFARANPEVPLHLGVTEAGMPPEGIVKTQIAFIALLGQGIGDTIRVSLTLPNDQKGEEVTAGYQILEDVAAGREPAVDNLAEKSLNIISCPSCSRVENESFVDLALKVRELTRYAEPYPITIAIMGCRVNGPGETDDADLGLWCGPKSVNLKRKSEKLGAYGYEEILPKLKRELDALIAQVASTTTPQNGLPTSVAETV